MRGETSGKEKLRTGEVMAVLGFLRGEALGVLGLSSMVEKEGQI